jgi:hypothetical protein
LFKDWKGVQQFEILIELLKQRPTSRQAVLQLFDSTDLAKPHKDVPCTRTLQFLMRDRKLHPLSSWGASSIRSPQPQGQERIAHSAHTNTVSNSPRWAAASI